MENLEQKIDALNPKLDQLLAALGAAAAASSLKAYERPPLGIDQVVVDGTTVNGDGSVWAKSLGDAPGSKTIQLYFGYISEKKYPEIWGAARAVNTPEQFAAWEDAWKRNPYGIYRADPRPAIANGTMDFVLFGYLLGAPVKTHVQD